MSTGGGRRSRALSSLRNSLLNLPSPPELVTNRNRGKESKTLRDVRRDLACEREKANVLATRVEELVAKLSEATATSSAACRAFEPNPFKPDMCKNCQQSHRVCGADVEEARPAEKEAAAAIEPRQQHAVFGELLDDMAFKQLWRADAWTLCRNVPIWSEQRPCDEGRVEEIAAGKRARIRDSCFSTAAEALHIMGTISVFQYVDGHDGSWLERGSTRIKQPCGVFDGQHRLRAIQRLFESSPPEDFHVLIEVYPVCRRSDIRDLFLEINKSQSVQEVDLPDALAPDRKRMIDEACNALAVRFSDMFKPTPRCRPPHLHLPTLRNRIFVDVPEAKLAGHSAGDLLAAMLACNEALGEREDWPEKTAKHLPKAHKFRFFLGLDPAYRWLETIIL